ncbi:hypothetical protein ACFOW1_16330 [Parasediminibacterium paludis]|uniref:DUF4468 domain-containing protein n=1 Tax=Parasediminibacterium paludis TaxID=908966 RepID=A0ABV8Q2T4_9BACT
MKNIFIVLLILSFAFRAAAQEHLKGILPLKNGKVTYSEVVRVDGLSKSEIYKRLRLWLAYNYEFSKFDNQELLISKGYFTYGNFRVWHILTIKIKDGRYKLELSNFEIQFANTLPIDIEGNYGSITKKSDFKQIDETVSKIILSLKTEGIKPIKDEDW